MHWLVRRGSFDRSFFRCVEVEQAARDLAILWRFSRRAGRSPRHPSSVNIGLYPPLTVVHCLERGAGIARRRDRERHFREMQIAFRPPPPRAVGGPINKSLYYSPVGNSDVPRRAAGHLGRHRDRPVPPWLSRKWLIVRGCLCGVFRGGLRCGWSGCIRRQSARFGRLRRGPDGCRERRSADEHGEPDAVEEARQVQGARPSTAWPGLGPQLLRRPVPRDAVECRRDTR